MEELWKDITGYEGLYKVSNLGRVVSFHRNKPRLLKPMINRKGYLRVELHNSDSGKLKSIHSLVMDEFGVPKPTDANYQINHIDGDKTNNRLDNLEWCTGSQNVRHAFSTRLKRAVFGEKHGMCKLTDNDVREIKLTYVKGDREFGSRSLAIKYNVHPTTIQKIVNGKFRKSVVI